ncbi:hypothetical protein D3C85_1515390 [compost metagenome]
MVQDDAVGGQEHRRAGDALGSERLAQYLPLVVAELDGNSRADKCLLFASAGPCRNVQDRRGIGQLLAPVLESGIFVLS